MIAEQLAGVTREGAILLGKNVMADAHADRQIRVVTHVHADHIRGLERSIRESILIVATTYTMELLEILGYKIPQEKMLSLSYDRPVDLLGERLTLMRARHIVGSAQVLVEGSGYRVGYTSDFKMPGTSPMRDLDVLVIDATYGSPRVQRKWSEWEAMAELVKIVETSIQKGPVEIYAYHGKMQEIMAELRIRGIREPFVTDLKGLRMAKVAERFYQVNLEPISTSAEPFAIYFRHANEFDESKGSATKILATGWELRAPVVRVNDGVYRVGFSDHATFKEILEYVREAKPKSVIVDASRGTDAWYTALYIQKKLGVPAVAQPSVE